MSKIAVCVCTYKRNELLAKLLSSLASAELNGSEIIVADNNPNAQGAAEICRSFLPIHYVHEPRRGISHARNRAAAKALSLGADFVSFIDDDDTPEPDWLTELLAEQERTGADIVFGRWRIANQVPRIFRDLPPFQAPRSEITTKYGVSIPKHMGTGNVLIRASLLVGQPFSPDFARGEDIDFFARTIKSGANFSVATASLVNRFYEPGRITVQGLLRLTYKRHQFMMKAARKHSSANEIAKRKRKAYKALLRAMLPPLHSPTRLMRTLYNAAGALGTLRVNN